MAESEQSLKLDVFDENVRNVGVAKEDAIECQGSSVVNRMGKISDEQLGDSAVGQEGIVQGYQEIVGVEEC